MRNIVGIKHLEIKMDMQSEQSIKMEDGMNTQMIKIIILHILALVIMKQISRANLFKLK